MEYSHPLKWPKGQRKTPKSMRIKGQFGGRVGAKGQGKGAKGALAPISLQNAEKALRVAIAGLNGYSATITTNMPVVRNEIRWDDKVNDGHSISVLFFVDDVEYLVACNKYDRLADNIAGVADYLALAKRMVSLGAGSTAKVLKGFRT